MNNTATAALREIVMKWMEGVIDQDANDEWKPVWPDCLSDLTALISEGYVEKAKYDELLKENTEMKAALKHINGRLDEVVALAEKVAGIKTNER